MSRRRFVRNVAASASATFDFPPPRRSNLQHQLPGPTPASGILEFATNVTRTRFLLSFRPRAPPLTPSNETVATPCCCSSTEPISPIRIPGEPCARPLVTFVPSPFPTFTSSKPHFSPLFFLPPDEFTALGPSAGRTDRAGI